MRERRFVWTQVIRVGNAVVVPVVKATVPVLVKLRMSEVVWTCIKRVEHPVPVVVIKTRGIALNPLHCQGKPDRIAVQPDGALRATRLDEACNNINVDVRRSVEITPGDVDTDNGLVARGKRRCVVGVHHVRVEFGGRKSTRSQSVGQQNCTVLQADTELKVVHHGGFRLSRKRHADAHVFAVHEGQAIGEHVPRLQEGAHTPLSRPRFTVHAGKVLRGASVLRKPICDALVDQPVTVVNPHVTTGRCSTWVHQTTQVQHPPPVVGVVKIVAPIAPVSNRLGKGRGCQCKRGSQ